MVFMGLLAVIKHETYRNVWWSTEVGYKYARSSILEVQWNPLHTADYALRVGEDEGECIQLRGSGVSGWMGGWGETIWIIPAEVTFILVMFPVYILYKIDSLTNNL